MEDINAIPLNLQRLDTSLDPDKEDERKRNKELAIKSYRKRFGDFNFNNSYTPMFHLLWYSQLPCTDVSGITSSVKDEISLIKRCYWKKKQVSCNSIFQKRPTDRGMCCSFNMEKAEMVLRNSKYTNGLSARQMQDAINGFETDQRPNWYRKNNEPRTKPGIENGLTLVFDAHSDRISPGSVDDSFQGAPVLIDHKSKFPMVRMSGITARPGFENRIIVNALDVTGLEQIKRYSPAQRKCYFPDEHKLKLHLKYSRSSCIFECEMEYAAKCISTCKQHNQSCDCTNTTFLNGLNLKSIETCVPWFYPFDDGDIMEICDPWETKKFKKIMEMQMPRYQCQHCLEDCSSTKYQTSISYSKLQECDSSNVGSFICGLTAGEINPAPWMTDAQNEYLSLNQSVPWFLNFNDRKQESYRFSNLRERYRGNDIQNDAIFVNKIKMNPYYNAFEKDIGIVHVFFAEREITRYVKLNKMSYFDFIYQIGGSLGLFLGISILSIVEIIYWITCRFFGSWF